MNKRIKKKVQRYNYCTAKQRRRNKSLCDRYPFLIPRYEWSDEIAWGKDIPKYSYTLAEDFPAGWWKAFGIMLCEELRDDLIRCNYLYEFRIVQIKEKFGELRVYTGSLPMSSKAFDIIDKYSHLSQNICIICGRPDVPMINTGWISPYCYKCFKKICNRQDRYYEDKPQRTDDQIKELYKSRSNDNTRMADTITWRRTYNGISYDDTVFIYETANAIREQWKMKGGE